jgi:hypothetical protein
MLKVDLLGTKELRDAIEKAEKKLVEGIDRQMDASVKNIHLKQVVLSPIRFGRLKAGNTFSVDKPLYKELENKIEYAPYQEFGTGEFTFTGETWMNPELMAIAENFKAKPLKRKVNMMPKPFFYAPFYEEVPKLIKAIEEILK